MLQPDPRGSALQAASDGGHAEIVQQLLKHGADINAQGGEYGNALQAASCKLHVETVQQLLEHGADVNAQGGYYGNALQAASYGGCTGIVRQLLKHGANIDTQGGEYGNTLQAGSCGGHLESCSSSLYRLSQLRHPTPLLTLIKIPTIKRSPAAAGPVLQEVTD